MNVSSAGTQAAARLLQGASNPPAQPAPSPVNDHDADDLPGARAALPAGVGKTVDKSA